MPKQQMTSQTRGIGQLLEERRYFEVPPHQRDYAWPIGAVEQFLDDILQAMNAGELDYFLGLIVLVDTEDPASKRYLILDGQQRLATATMVYAAIRQWLRDRGMDGEANKIQNQFIGISEIGEPEDEPRLILNIANRATFQQAVVNPSAENILNERLEKAGRHSSTRKLLEAALFCRSRISGLAATQANDEKAQAQILFRLARFLRDNAQVDCLDVNEPEDAYTIFESLNDRGVDLSVLDLLKNHMFREAGSSKQAQVQTNWFTMVARLGDRRGDDFIKVFWTSRYGRIQRGRLFKELKNHYKTTKGAVDLSEELAATADVYANLEVADADIWRSFSPNTKESVRALAILGSRQAHPIILAALERFDPPQMEKLLQHIVILILRYQLIGRERTGRLEIQSASIAKGIYTKKLKTAQAVWREARAILPDDSEFKEDFSRYEESRAARARWILSQLEMQAWREANPGKAEEKAPISNPAKINLEHVLPRNPGTAWSAEIKADPKLVKECVTRLGNMCLLDKGSNKREAAAAISQKARIYTRSELVLTRSIAKEHGQWNRATIEARQRELADLAIRTWPID